MTVNIKESINRGFNLLAVSVSSLSGFAFLPEAFVEQDIPDKIDDALIAIIGLLAIWWYTRSNNRYRRSILPVVLVSIAFIIKVIGLIIEIDDPEAFGDDIGGVILFAIATGLTIYQYQKNKKLLEASPV